MRHVTGPAPQFPWKHRVISCVNYCKNCQNTQTICVRHEVQPTPWPCRVQISPNLQAFLIKLVPIMSSHIDKQADLSEWLAILCDADLQAMEQHNIMMTLSSRL